MSNYQSLLDIQNKPTFYNLSAKIKLFLGIFIQVISIHNTHKKTGLGQFFTFKRNSAWLYLSLNSLRSILPTLLFGSSSLNSTIFGIL